ncbi:glycosyltransferase [Algibacter pectinivorans]|uniref:Glycosyl transferase family 2 n=1 Tax=Algibacter pectinivorans TaxID=870482 RepID=A0A1I1P4W8_9FLAO|nr:glycosyltransferase [Algibacter pectinivorans]SFD04622.1 Glycosyl transferase family 2 [Algibacter pectinivorans]
MVRIGIIIVCHNIEKHINVDVFVKHFNKAKNIELCFVNNASKDNTYQILKDIKEISKKDFSILDIKRYKSDQSAIRSGSRYMFSQFNLNHIGFVSSNILIKKQYSLCSLIKHIRANQDFILQYSKQLKEDNPPKQTLFQSVFSITEYLDKSKVQLST